ncbi:MAG: sensor histidine kinase [Bryobacteraceae bacterium]
MVVLFPPNFAWRPYTARARVLLTSVGLAVVFLALPDASIPLRAVMALFVAYALALAIHPKGPSRMAGLLILFADAVYFLVLASFATERLQWMAAVFFLFLATEGLAFYSPVEVAVITGISAIFCAVLPNTSNRILEPTVLVAGALACGFAVSRERLLNQVRALEAKLEETRQAVDRARDGERVRIAADFHDGPLQSFISLQMRLEILRKLLERNFQAGMEDLKQLQALANTQIRDLRLFLHSMRPVDVDGANLVAMARRAAEAFQKESGIPVTFAGSASPVGLPQEMSSEVLQMLREALHNVQKHAGASRVAVSMEKADRGLEIAVEDNGHGFPFAGTYTLEELELLRLGPASLKRRARSLNADLVLESRPGRGAGLRLRVPLQ